MKERPIIFSPELAAKVHAGTKTVTRRIINTNALAHSGIALWTNLKGDIWRCWTKRGNDYDFRCPFGSMGGELWVRERFAIPIGIRPAEAAKRSYLAAYLADNPVLDGLAVYPSIHMPRAFSRTLLEIVSVRAERLQDIDDVDAVAEGVSNIADFHALWDRINGTGKRSAQNGWDANPWVWRVEFERIGP